MSKKNDPLADMKARLGRARTNQRAAFKRGEKPKKSEMQKLHDADAKAEVDALMKHGRHRWS